MWKPSFVVLHNTANPTIAEWHGASGADRMKNLASYYRDHLGWHAGPHLFVADDLIWVFTPLTVPGINTPSWNDVSWGVEMVGNYQIESFTAGKGVKVRDNAVYAVAVLSKRIGLDSHSMKLHHEDPKTTHKGCPGVNVHKADFIARVHAQILALG